MKLYTRNERLMGSMFSFGVISHSAQSASEYLQHGVNEVRRLENKFSEFIPTSTTSVINQKASSDWVKIDEESFNLISRSIAISRLTKGDFDITVGPLKKLYRFDKRNTKLPSKNSIAKAMAKVGYQKLHLDKNNCCIKFEVEGMHLSFAAIGKGYAADSVISQWQELGLSSGYVNASGDIRAVGVNESGLPWKAGIADPDDIEHAALQVSLTDNAIATSGNSEQYFISSGQKYSHNIDPKKGTPLRYIKSVTVISPSAELSDALATAVYVKGAQLGREMINQLPNTHAIIIGEDEEQIYFTKSLEYESLTHTADSMARV